MKGRKTYLDGLRRAHEVAMSCLPFPGCRSKKALLRLGAIMCVPIRAIEDEIMRTEGKTIP